MNVEIKVPEFLEAFAAVAAVAPTRSPKEVLQNVRLTATETGAVLEATDLEVSARLTLPDGDITVLKAGSVLLNARWMMTLLREVNEEVLVLEVDDGTLRITGAKAKFKLPTQNPDEFPAVVAFDADKFHEINSRAFATALKRTMMATDTDTSRYALGGVKLEVEKKEGRLIGTDGRRLAVAKFDVEPVGGSPKCPDTTIIPVRAAQMIERAASHADDVVQIAARINDVIVRVGNVDLYARLVEGRYPNWKQVIPSADDAGATDIVTGTLSALVRQAAITTNQESRGIDFTMKDGQLTLESSTAELGESRVQTPVKIDGEGQEATVDNRFVLDFCKVVPAEDAIRFGMNAAGPLRLTAGPEYTYIVMPMARS